MTSYSGIYILHPKDIKQHTKISFEHRVINALFDQLPKHDFYYQQFLPSFKNWMPLYWRGYTQSTRYTFRISTQNDRESKWSNLKSTVRTNIRKAETIFKVSQSNFGDFWDNLESSYNGRKKSNPFRKEVLHNIFKALYPQEKCQLLVAFDNETQIIEAGIMLVKDQKSCYYICGFFNEESKNKHPFSLLLWEAIKTTDREIFDFEGSMIKEIESFFRTFGGVLTPHYKIWKTRNPILKFLFKLKKPEFLD